MYLSRLAGWLGWLSILCILVKMIRVTTSRGRILRRRRRHWRVSHHFLVPSPSRNRSIDFNFQFPPFLDSSIFKEVVCLEDSKTLSLSLSSGHSSILASQPPQHFFLFFLHNFIIFTSCVCVFLLIILCQTASGQSLHIGRWLGAVGQDTQPLPIFLLHAGTLLPLTSFCLQHAIRKHRLSLLLSSTLYSGISLALSRSWLLLKARNPNLERVSTDEQRVSDPISVCVKCRMFREK